MITRTPDGRHLYYETEGDGQDILFVHGAGGSNEGMKVTAERLTPRFRCTHFDRLGWRRSAHLDRDTTAEEQIQGIEALHKAVTDEPVWLFGHSSGGNFALAYAVARPESVQGCVLMEPALYAIYPPDETPAGVTRLEQETMPLFRQGRHAEGLASFGAAVFGTSSDGTQRPALTAAQRETWRAFIYDQPVVISWRPSDEDLRGLSKPVLIVEGDQSPEILRGVCRLLQEALPSSSLVTIEGHGHGACRTAPDRMAKEVEAFICTHS